MKFDNDVPPPITKKLLADQLSLAKMKVKQSFFYPGDIKTTDKVANAVREFAKAQDPAWLFVTERRSEAGHMAAEAPEVETEGMRVWRMK